ncbi:PREDICTED: carcinoembryonic antigen-related cell adhesion molecule 1-like, partial [Nipponia nippon]|uniref:carcinoembryonic antigen-related cell adhesion molecule 1-like n=1 Tax=Nipponia nippon TaxID=128390 RepID=UPI000510D7A9
MSPLPSSDLSPHPPRRPHVHLRIPSAIISAIPTTLCCPCPCAVPCAAPDPSHPQTVLTPSLSPRRGPSSCRPELLAQPAVTPDNVTVVENDTITLTCRSPPGTQMVAWLHDGVTVSADGRLSLSPDNRTLTVWPAQRGDAGAYVCQVSNAVSTNRSEDVNIAILYGPDSITVTPPGPLRLQLGSRLELCCTAAAAPPPLFAWTYEAPVADSTDCTRGCGAQTPASPTRGAALQDEVKYSTLAFRAPGGAAPHSPPQLDGCTIYSE